MSAPDGNHRITETETTDDGFLGGGLHMLQPKRGYRAGLEAVFLAASVPAVSGDSALEAGCGVGVAALCLARRVAGARVNGVEIEPSLLELAQRNAERNGLSETVRFSACNILGGTDGSRIAQNTHAHVFANPPFFTSDRARCSSNPLKKRAHVCERADLDGWVRFLVSTVVPAGTVTLIYRAEALGELLHLLDRRVGDCRIFPLYPRVSQAASRVIIQGTKGSKAPASLLRGLVLHGPGDEFTSEAQSVLRQGAGLRLQ